MFRSFIGLGYSDTLTPSVIRRCVFENPGWYTPYTPYQAEIAQGRLESLLNFQTMVSDLTGMAVANASLLDEGTAAGEAMALLHRVQGKKLGDAHGTFLVSDRCLPADASRCCAAAPNRSASSCEVGRRDQMTFDAPDVFGALRAVSGRSRALDDLKPFIDKAHAAGVQGRRRDRSAGARAGDVARRDAGADCVFGNSQRFGVPLGFGGPHAAFFATSQEFVRHMPGRVIGVSIDAHGHRAYRMSLQTREQHIRREKATSNICTAQALLANMAAMYAVYHGPEGIKAIATRVHALTRALDGALQALGYQQQNAHYFDTLRIDADARASRRSAPRPRPPAINFRYVGDARDRHLARRDGDHGRSGDGHRCLRGGGRQEGAGSSPSTRRRRGRKWPGGAACARAAYLTHPVFNSHRSESEMMRYIRSLERKDVGLDTSMIPLGSCTMKLNAASEMYPVSWEEFSRMHPFAPADQTRGLSPDLSTSSSRRSATITGFAAVSLQPNSGAQGEFAGLAVMRAYHQSRGEGARDVVLIPASAHGTNPASAIMAGFKVVVVATDAERQRRRRRSEEEGRGAREGSRRPDDHVSLDARRVRGCDPRHLRARFTSTAARSTWTAPT